MLACKMCSSMKLHHIMHSFFIHTDQKFSGGQDTVEEHRRLGGNIDVNVFSTSPFPLRMMTN